MKRITVPDGMYRREGRSFVPDDWPLSENPEWVAYRAENARRATVEGYLEDLERAVQAELADLPNIEAGDDSSQRRLKDMRAVEIAVGRLRSYRDAGDQDKAVRAAIDVGIAAHIALHARAFEPEVLHDRHVKKQHRDGLDEHHGTSDDIERRKQEWVIEGRRLRGTPRFAKKGLRPIAAEILRTLKPMKPSREPYREGTIVDALKGKLGKL